MMTILNNLKIVVNNRKVVKNYFFKQLLSCSPQFLSYMINNCLYFIIIFKISSYKVYIFNYHIIVLIK